GKVVVVDVWSTSCAPCMREFPHLVALSKNTDSDKLACISLNVDYIGLKSKPPESYLGKVQEFLQQQQADQVTNLLSAATDEAVLSEFQLVSIPAILIYSADGTLKHALTDANTGDDGLSYEGDVIPLVTALLATQ
ncbi:MAG: TlpA family protein disulfide reductase, partial [Planctomycetales bacterium]|nr:TlpA family protein disulfide reductase [Planctomycetales bacterium]